MTTIRPTAKLIQSVLGWWAVLAAIYTILIFILPANQKTMVVHHLSAFEYHILYFAVVLPYMFVWLAAFWGYAALQQYAKSIKKTKEGAAFSHLARGCYWLAWGLPVTAITSLVLNSAADSWHGWHTWAAVLTNYVAVIFSLIAFSIIGSAARELLNSAKLSFSLAGARLIMLLFAFAGVVYCILTFRHFVLNSLGSTDNPYLLPVWLVVLTITVPYLYAWFIGLLGAYEITLLGKNVSGVLYRRAMTYVAVGLVTVVLSFIALQYISGIAPPVGHLVLNTHLLFTLLFRVLGGLGFICLGFGAVKLKRIEEV